MSTIEEQTRVDLPTGFCTYVANIGVKDTTDDFVVIAAATPVTADGVFTKSRFAGPSVTLSRSHLINHRARAMVIISKNANVATGPDGAAHAHEVTRLVAQRLGCESSDVLLASTGVIGRQYPMDRITAGCMTVPENLGAPGTGHTDAVAAAVGIMTTDTIHKVSSAVIGAGPARVVGIAKGVGMIEPDMATMISVLLTDADLPADQLSIIFRRVMDRSFNCVSVDSDTSTSDTAIILASGAAGHVDLAEFEAALLEVAISLTKQVARDGEGAETLIEVHVTGARDDAQAKRVAKSIVNSPLVKTAVHGADPNWGRVAMAIGKCSDDTDIDQDLAVISFGGTEVYPRQLSETDLAALSTYMAGDEVVIGVDLRIGSGVSTVWGCDLTDGYIRINADYTT
jgi:glutamate N-acetyltransferase / amino-acid N-acetyltransferase